ncbi:hypothetical protein [Lignipirellula cremea]|uniref:Uncharacterized protein n=1 Tax=Lignipirellula cremea TaxID=2528010 RepID=A0A518DSK8_9BACT|nr:hypothetical protein [Lignipirellula cremea]QDU94819.1 hypothetical protein Pla8534_26270 [Lignipirellula cremea]
MRLTLRTLLAFRSGLLSATDWQALSEKLGASPTAQALDERLDRLVQGPLRTGDLPDANEVSAYLSNDLPVDRVGAFEKQCLASHAALEETAACSAALTVMMTSVHKIDRELRNRILQMVADHGANGRL